MDAAKRAVESLKVVIDVHPCWRRSNDPGQGTDREPREAFTYARLDTTRSEIRLLTLEPTSSGSQIQCQLTHASLDNTGDPPSYDAVSYTWSKNEYPGLLYLSIGGIAFSSHESLFKSTPGKPRPILCNGQRMYVQENIYKFMLQLRRRKWNRPLWIDAICIEQSGDAEAQAEKVQQLKLMGRIYESARRVLVWIGDLKLGSSMLRLVNKMPPVDVPIAQLIEHDNAQNTLSARSDAYLSRALESDALNFKRFRGSKNPMSVVEVVRLTSAFIKVIKLVNTDYFRRSWVVQELILARELQFFVGQDVFSQDEMEKVLLLLLSLFSAQGGVLRLLTPFRVEDFLSILKARSDRNDGTSWSLEEYLSLCRAQKVTQAEDKIFAILGLVDPLSSTTLATNAGYGDVRSVYMRCVNLLVQRSSWPYVLSLVGKVEPGCTTLPSWIPDFSVAQRPLSFADCGLTGFQATAGRAPLFEIAPADFVLRISAALIDVIQQVGESSNVLMPSMQNFKIRGYMLDIMNHIPKTYRPTGELAMTALIHTLTAGAFCTSNYELATLHQEFGEFMVLRYLQPMHIWDTNKHAWSFIARLYDHASLNPGMEKESPRLNDQDLKTKPVVEDFLRRHDDDVVFGIKKRYNKYSPRRTDVKLARIGVEESDEESDDESDDSEDDSAHEVEDMRDPANPLLNSGSAFEKAFQAVYKDRRVFRTEEHNYLGIGSMKVQQGDLVMLVAGLDTPYVFRREAEGSNRLTLVGSAYVHGIMYGEAAVSPMVSFREYEIM